MQKINLRELYPDMYKTDTFLEVTDEVQAVFLSDKRAEAAHERQMYRYKAYYSLDCDKGIEDVVVHRSPTPEEVLEDKQLRDQIYTAVMELPDKQAKRIYVYHCISNNRIKKGVCPGAFIFEKELLDTLADMIQEQLDTTLGQYSLGLENLSKEAEEQKNIQAKIASRKQEIQQLRTYQRGLYEGLIQNHLSKDEYFTFKEKYEAKIEAISKEIEQLKAGLAIIAKQLEQYKMLSQDAQHIKEDRQLTAALIDRLIDRVEVSREKRITVRFRFQSEFEHCEEVLSQCRNM